MSDIPLGSTKNDLDTPALCVDLDAMEENVATMVAACKKQGVAWRPHAKCHKSPEIARRLIEAGAVGATCAKLGEAEVLVAGGVKDLLVANMIVGGKKLCRLVELCTQANIIVAVDHVDQAEPISRAAAAAGVTVGMLIEVDVGLGRVGCQSVDQAVSLAQRIATLPGIRFEGVMAYEGHLLTIDNATEKRTAIEAALSRLIETKRQIEAAGVACPVVSCGGTGSYEITVAYPGVTELQAGGAIFMDAFYRQACGVESCRYALTALVTVVSRPTRDRAVIDTGRKTLSKEVHLPIVLGRDDMVATRFSAEHGELELAPSAQNLRIGDRLELVVGYADLTVNMNDLLYGFRGDRLETIFKISARGRSQ